MGQLGLDGFSNRGMPKSLVYKSFGKVVRKKVPLTIGALYPLLASANASSPKRIR
jgi:hypothetical protein